MDGIWIFIDRIADVMGILGIGLIPIALWIRKRFGARLKGLTISFAKSLLIAIVILSSAFGVFLVITSVLDWIPSAELPVSNTGSISLYAPILTAVLCPIPSLWLLFIVILVLTRNTETTE